jgi:hypothetical protein
MLDSPLFPWVASENESPLTQDIKDPNSPAKLTLPKLNGLTVNEVLFAQWAAQQDKKYPFLSGSLDSNPLAVIGLTDFCHKFLCLRLGLADWGGENLVFDGEPLKPEHSLTLPLPNGQRKAAPLYCLYLIYGFFVDEQRAWLTGKPSAQMMKAIEASIKPTGPTSTGDSNELTQVTDDLPAETSDDAQSASSKGRSDRPKRQNIAA